jgi:hypothetical protein
VSEGLTEAWAAEKGWRIGSLTQAEAALERTLQRVSR